MKVLTESPDSNALKGALPVSEQLPEPKSVIVSSFAPSVVGGSCNWQVVSGSTKTLNVQTSLSATWGKPH